MAKHLLHIGFALAIAALALKAAFMPPRLRVTLRPGESAALDDAVLVLKNFTVPKYPDGRPRQYVSDVHLVTQGANGAPEARHAAIAVNRPMRWNGWWIYQSAYDAEREAYTVLEAVHDPFLPLAAAAGLLLLAGAAALCRRRRLPRPNGSPAGLGGAAVRFAVATAVVMLPLWIAGRVLLTRDLVPALQSPLLVPHVGAYIVAYAILIFAAFGIGVRFVPFGFFLMTLALVLGATWGKICWGDWWQYDPKEMWSLATWLAFAVYFHVRRPAVAKAVLWIGAALIVLTLTWVNFAKMFKGLHTYV